MYLAREHTGETLPAIGRAFGGRNHTTVMHACRRTAERLAADPEAFESVRRLTERPAERRRRPTDVADRLRGLDPPRDVRASPAIVRALRGVMHTSTAPMTSDPFSEVSIVKFVDVVRSELLAQLADRLPRRLDAQRRPGAVRRPDRRRRRPASSCAPPTWRSACASRSRPRSSAPGTVVLPARLLLDVVRSLPGGDVVARAAPGRAGRRDRRPAPRTFHIRTLRAEDFPPLPEPGGDQVVTMPAPAFVETIARVARSASRDETRPILTGILVSASGDELRMVATDSYRLSVKETAARGAAGRRLRGQRAGPRAGGARPPGARRRRGRSASACAPTRSSSRSAASCSRRG